MQVHLASPGKKKKHVFGKTKKWNESKNNVDKWLVLLSMRMKEAGSAEVNVAPAVTEGPGSDFTNQSQRNLCNNV